MVFLKVGERLLCLNDVGPASSVPDLIDAIERRRCAGSNFIHPSAAVSLSFGGRLLEKKSKRESSAHSRGEARHRFRSSGQSNSLKQSGYLKWITAAEASKDREVVWC